MLIYYFQRLKSSIARETKKSRAERKMHTEVTPLALLQQRSFFMSNFDDLDAIFGATNDANDKVNSGEIQSSITRWPKLSGICTLKSVQLTQAGSSTFINFYLEHDTFQSGKFGVMLPKSTHSQTAISIRMQQIYQTVFAAAGKNPKECSPKQAFVALQEQLKKGPMLCEYKLEERETESQKTGRTFVNQDLVFLVPVEETQEVGFGI